MTITKVAWGRDNKRRSVLEFVLDGRQAYIPSCQKSKLLRRGIVDGLVFLASERAGQTPRDFIRGSFGPELTETDLNGCTDDPRVFALYEEMCNAIRADAWQPGARPLTA